jgi:hypothetical protein
MIRFGDTLSVFQAWLHQGDFVKATLLHVTCRRDGLSTAPPL